MDAQDRKPTEKHSQEQPEKEVSETIMNAQTIGNTAVPAGRALHERAALACLPGKFTWMLVSLFAATLIVDFLGAPQMAATSTFLAGLFIGAVAEAIADLFARRKLNFEDNGPLFMTAKVVSSLNAAVFLAVLALIFGDAALQGVSTGFAAALGFAGGLIGASRGRVPTLVPVSASAAVSKAAEAGRALTEKDRQFAALHEAGHALTLAMVPQSWREGAFVQIGDSKSTFTNVPRNESAWQLAPYRRWEMMMLLGGPVAADLAYGAPMEGGASDMREWRHKAMAVLTAERAEGWTINPQDELEYEANQRLMKAMEREQTAALIEFFEENDAIYQALAQHILANDGADPETLDRFLEDVVMSAKINAALGL
jgi:hypothetical protein